MQTAPKKDQPELGNESSFEQLRLRNEILQRELAELRVENSRLKVDSAVLQEVLSSTMWRATGPVRLAIRFAKGEFGFIRSLRWLMAVIGRAILPGLVRRGLSNASRSFAHPPGNTLALKTLVDRRCAFATGRRLDPARAPAPVEWPELDLSLVTFNSGAWLRRFIDSLAEQDYPLDKINLRFVDHGSTDGTLVELHGLRSEYQGRFACFELLTRPNRGFGAGHNVGIRAGRARFCLVANVDLRFEKDSLTRVVAMACADDEDVACWELRQKPYEHPKFYDPVTLETNWCSHACVLLRRSSFGMVGGYDETIFMYGEDVELSYRFRQRGLRLRYCPSSAVWHFAYEHANQVKPLQFSGSVFANFYLRLRYGAWREVATMVPLAARLLGGPETYAGSRRDVRRAITRLLRSAPSAVARRRRSSAAFPFRAFDYDLVREGAFVAATPEPACHPLVSVVTRTVAGRGDFLAQAMLSVAHQTYPNIEYLVVEDGGGVQREVVHRISETSRMPVTYLPVPKMGRSAAGNAGLAAAKGEYVVFLDDDDLLFADHVSTLMQALRDAPEAVAAYSLAWEVPTDSRPGGGYAERMPILRPAAQQDFDPVLLRRLNYIPIQAMLFKRSLYLERGGFDTEIDYLEDWNLWNRYAVGNTFTYVPKVTSMYRTPIDPVLVFNRQKALDSAYAMVASRNAQLILAIEEERSRQVGRLVDPRQGDGPLIEEAVGRQDG